jgi:hypothetical protein
MTTLHMQHRSGARAARCATFCLFALLAVLCLSGQTYGQWVTQGTSTTTTNNVGIGTPNPAAALDVRGNLVLETATNPHLYTGTGTGELNRYLFVLNSPGLASASGLKAGGALISDDYGFANPGKNNLIVKGNVGIGTPAPASMLDVMGSTGTPFRVRDGSGREYLSTTARTGASGTTIPTVSLAGARLIVDNDGPEGGNSTIIRRGVNSMFINPSDNATLPGGFIVRQVGGVYGLVVNQNTNGNVGIGLNAPLAKLHVAGDIRVDGNINAKYQDVAEWVPTLQAMPAGTVVVLDIERDNHVTASTRSYDTRVAGVVSPRPGISLGDAGEGKALVATTGRVKVRVDATSAPIKIGDLLVTGETPGVAMRSQPLELGGVQMHRPGTLIGKALQSLDKGTGEILVLLSLQ